jgi:ABC-type branched-subunit amino acid transport system substrate-binding protein
MENTETHTGYLVDEFRLYYEGLGGSVTDTIGYYYSTDFEYINKILSRLENSTNPDTAIFYPDALPYSMFYFDLNEYPRLLNRTWFASSNVNSNYTSELSVTPEMDRMKLIHTVLDESPDTSNSLYMRIKDEYYAEFGENLTKYKGNIYDAVWLSALTVIEIGEYNNTAFIEAFPRVAGNYTGVSGNCSLDKYGDRLHADYHIYRYVLRDENIYLKEIGYLDTSKPEITWLE